jgi:glycosyltransferase involved in cell wall biosynthesis
MDSIHNSEVVFWTERFGAHIGGLEKRLADLAAGLVRHGVPVRIVCGVSSASPDHFRLDVLGPDFLRRSFDAIQRHVAAGGILYCARLSQAAPRLHAQMLRRLPRGIVIVRVPTTQAARVLVRHGVVSALDHASARFHALNTASYRTIRRRATFSSVVRYLNPALIPTSYSVSYHERFVYCGRLTPSKNAHTLIKAWEMIEHRGLCDGSRLAIYGVPYHSGYETEVRRLTRALDRIELLSPYGAENPASSAHAVVLPSFREGHPNILSEAFANGTPVIGSRIPGIAEHVSSERGWLIDTPADPASIIDALESSWHTSPSQYTEFVKAARRYAEVRLSEDIEASDLLALVQRRAY